ncbi:helix-turn-helix domain-containing protein [Eggerthella sinensis]|uniref:helix-turn-helix domain-containing protein n=1 Tax=Eggerthella sinensis TaxID=242230 RepID=UPI00248E753F|nr:helix-turn-helix domain-containing protein [Eggerthella sinensis]
MGIVYSTEDLGLLIRSERKAQGYTQTELAELANTSLSFLSNLENGKDSSEIGKALRIVATLGIDLVAERRDEQA